MVVLAVLLAVVALLLALAVGGLVLAERGAARRTSGDEALPGDVVGLRREVAALRAETHGALRHLAVVRYDAFDGRDGAGGQLSWSLALADDTGSGVLLTSITGRSEARSYAKAITGWACEQPLSPEEADALAAAQAG